MCWCWPFGSNTQKRNKSQVREKKKRDGYDSLHGNGVAVIAEVREPRRSRETAQKKRSRETPAQRESRKTKEAHRPREEYRPRQEYRTREPQRPALNVQVPDLWHRTVEPASSNSSTEMLLNPRPHRSPHTRQRHPKRTSQTTLRGRGAKRDPPSKSKSKKSPKQETVRQTGWSFFSPSPPKTPQRRSHTHYQHVYDTSPRSDRSRRHHHRTDYQTIPHATQHQPQPYASTHQQQPRHHRSRQHATASHHAARTSRSRTPNSSARRTPDRRFAVLAATNQALEDLRREAFAQPSPPPRRERLQRYQGVAIPTSQIPFNWDCVSSSQTSAGQTSTAHAGSSRRRSRR